MIGSSITAGVTGIRRRPGLGLLLYALNLVIALVLAVPVYVTLGGIVEVTGFGSDLAGGFDLVLWADIIEEAGELLQALQIQLLWMVPLYLGWKAASSVGLIHALRGDRVRSFWQGVGRYTGKAALLGGVFLVLAVIGLFGVVVVGLVLGGAWTGEVGAFWTNFVVVPTLVISVLAVVDLMHDYARMALVIDEQGVWQAMRTGVTWPFRHGQANWLYVGWFVPAAVLLLLPTVLDMNATASTAGAVWGLFLTQQVLLLLRAAITVGWFGSETALYEAVRLREMPLIATDGEELPTLAPEEDVLGTAPGFPGASGLSAS